MKKKIFSLLLVLILSFGLVACSSGDGGNNSQNLGKVIVDSSTITVNSNLDVSANDLDLKDAKVKIGDKSASVNEEISIAAGTYNLTVSAVLDESTEYYGTKTVIVEKGTTTPIKDIEIDKSRAYVPDGKVRIHYQRSDENYDDYTMWVWKDVKEKSSGWPEGKPLTGTDDFGGYYDIDLADNPQDIGFFPVDAKENKDGEDHLFEFLDEYKNLYIFEGDNTVYISPDKDVPAGILNGEVISPTEIKLSFTDAEVVTKNDLTVVDKNGNEVEIDSYQILNEEAGKVIGNLDPESEAPYEVTYDGKTVEAGIGISYKDSLTAYEGDDLGATYNNDGTATLKLWTPEATKVKVDVYDKNDQTNKVGTTELTKGDKGVWSVTLDDSNVDGVSDLDGYFYQYRVTVDGEERKALDPYAKSMAEFKVDTDASNTDSVDEVGKAAIVDPSSTGPDLDFANVNGFEKREDAIIWEIHVRDFTSQEGLSLNNEFGTYEAFTEKLEYLKELGVTHVQLLPVMSYYYGDERKADQRESTYSAQDNNYNWGYDPHSYFAPEGMYSDNAKDPETRINELKTLIKAIHDQGMAVTLDVVYNHMAQEDILDRIYPDYYFRENSNSGVGNDTATTHDMMRKLIVDSLVYWTEEYNVDGFRFDLMGIIDTKTISEAYNEVEKINPDTLFIGEGWDMYSGPAGTQGADQAWMDQTDNVAVFSDEMRNELKSGYGSEGQKRFITGGAREIGTIFDNIKAQPSNTPADDPGDMVQYIAAHDNLTLHDVIAHSAELDPDSHEKEIQKRIRLGNTMILTSQGIAFLHGGQEYGRTKEWKGSGTPEGEETEVEATGDYFINNSYDSSDIINEFDWDAATGNGIENETMEYTKGLIALRKSTDAFRLGTQSEVDSNVELLYPVDTEVEDKIIAYKTTDSAGENDYYVFINGDKEVRDFTITTDLTSGTVLVDDDEAGASEVSEVSGVDIGADTVTLQPLTVAVVKVTQ